VAVLSYACASRRRNASLDHAAAYKRDIGIGRLQSWSCAKYHSAGRHAARSITENGFAVPIRKDRGKIQVGLRAHTEVAAGMGIDRDDRLQPDLEIAAHRPD
jgi:hypothetical protein